MWTLKIRVTPDGEPAFDAEVRKAFRQYGNDPPIGMGLSVLYDPNDHTKVVVDDSQERRPTKGQQSPQGKSVQEMMQDMRSLTPDEQRERALAQQARMTGGSPSGPADEIAKLADLRDRGALTAEEFENQKAKLLGES